MPIKTLPIRLEVNPQDLDSFLAAVSRILDTALDHTDREIGYTLVMFELEFDEAHGRRMAIASNVHKSVTMLSLRRAHRAVALNPDDTDKTVM